MTPPWKQRAPEEKNLLGPSFCSTILWNAASAYAGTAHAALPFELAFLVLPITLHLGTRESLPRAIATSLAVWLEQNPLARSRIADRARALVPFTKDALLFGGIHGLLDLSSGAVSANANWMKNVAVGLADTSDEVRDCAKRAEFVGKWFAKTGEPGVVMALLGVRP